MSTSAKVQLVLKGAGGGNYRKMLGCRDIVTVPPRD